MIEETWSMKHEKVKMRKMRRKIREVKYEGPKA